MPNGNNLIEEGIAHLNAGRYLDALLVFEKIDDATPKCIEAGYGKAIALCRLNQFEEARNCLDIILMGNAEHTPAKLLRNEISAELKADRKDIHGKIQTDVPESRVEQLISDALNAMEADNFKLAFDLLVEAKKLRIPVRNLDYCRGIYFVKMNQLPEADEALKEELLHFPDNAEARMLLEQVQAETKEALNSFQDEEFAELYEAIRPYTMLSQQRLFSLFELAKHICQVNIPGNFVECGVAAGGSSALLAYIIKRYSRQPRWLYSFDSFDRIPEESLKAICAKLGALDVVFQIKGHFEDTLPKNRNHVGMISLLHLEGDWYESTKAILVNLYDHVVNDGVLQVDNYGDREGCRKTIHDFEAAHNLKFELQNIDGTAISFRKPNRFKENQAIPKEMIDLFSQDDPIIHGIVSQMSANERFQLYYLIRTHVKGARNPTRFVEIGSYAGASLLLSYIALKRTVPAVQGFAVEPSGEGQFYEILKLLAQDVSHLKMFSDKASLILKDRFSDGNLAEFMLIDGDHSYEGVRQDIINYYPLLAPGGIMCFHDFLPALDDRNRDAIFFHHANKEPGIRHACIELMEREYRAEVIELPLLFPEDPTQTQAHLPIIPGVFSTIRAYRKTR